MGATLLAEPHPRPFPPSPENAKAVAPGPETEFESWNRPPAEPHRAVLARRRQSPHVYRHQVIVPVRSHAWLNGDIGASLQQTLASALSGRIDARVTRLQKRFLVESDEELGPLVEAVHQAVVRMEQEVGAAYPVFHHEMGPVWTGTLQSVFG